VNLFVALKQEMPERLEVKVIMDQWGNYTVCNPI